MKTIIKRKIWLRMIPLIPLVGLLFWMTSCSKPGASAKPADVDYYTCTMHPSVKKHSPTDKCPICSMDLVPVKKQVASDMSAHTAHAGHMGMSDTASSKNMSSDDKPGEFTVPVARQQQIGVTYGTI